MFQISESFPEGNICDAMLCHPALRDNLKKYIPQTGLAVMYLHSQGIVHRNVKLENFLVCNQSTVCVPFTGCLNMTQRIVHVTYVQPAGTSLGGGGGNSTVPLSFPWDSSSFWKVHGDSKLDIAYCCRILCCSQCVFLTECICQSYVLSVIDQAWTTWDVNEGTRRECYLYRSKGQR